MASPKTMWSGSIELGLLNIPITIGKATSEEREQSLIQVCVHDDGTVEPVDKSERCGTCGGPPTNKRKAVRMDEDEYRLLSEEEMNAIEDATKLETLEVLDVQPLDNLPLEFSLGTYYLRHNQKAKVAPKTMATLVASLTRGNKGLICKWGNSSRQKLVVISAEAGVMIMRVIPFLDSLRPASMTEREHFRVKLNPAEVAKMDELLEAMQNPDRFDYPSYHDDGLRLRQEAVARILKGEKPVEKAPPKVAEHIDDLQRMIDKSIAEARS